MSAEPTAWVDRNPLSVALDVALDFVQHPIVGTENYVLGGLGLIRDYSCAALKNYFDSKRDKLNQSSKPVMELRRIVEKSRTGRMPSRETFDVI